MGTDPDNGDPILRLVYSLVAKKAGDNFQFYSLLETIKSQWNKRKIGNILFYYNDVFNEGIAKGFAEFNTQLAHKLGVGEIDVSYFKGRDGRELFYLIGCDYINNAYFAKTGGLADPSRNYIFAGNNSEAYPHELVHLYIAKKFSGPRNYIAEEGYCTYMGGSGELSLEELLARLRDYLDENAGADLLNLFMFDFQIDGEHSTMYAVSGLLMKTIESEHGMEGISRIITAENQPDAYFRVLEELLGINEGNFTDNVNSLLNGRE